jgi:hypothetical protein
MGSKTGTYHPIITIYGHLRPTLQRQGIQGSAMLFDLGRFDLCFCTSHGGLCNTDSNGSLQEGQTPLVFTSVGRGWARWRGCLVVGMINYHIWTDEYRWRGCLAPGGGLLVVEGLCETQFGLL